MPVRSLSSSVLRWPDLAAVREALARWAPNAAATRPDVERIGVFGSCARGDWGVGSDLDLVIVVSHSRQPFERRAAEWDTSGLPVPADVLVYTDAEFASLPQDGRFRRTLERDTQWLYIRRRG